MAWYRIVPATPGQMWGAKVFDDEGRELHGVRSIEWRHNAGDLPTIRLELVAQQVEDLSAPRERIVIDTVATDDDAERREP